MALIQQIKPNGIGIGQTRWIIRAAPRMNEGLIQTLRPFVTEYPERWPTNPKYPEPGKRSGSRPPSAQGDIIEPIETNPDGTPKTPAAPRNPITTYPVARDRTPSPENPDGYFTTPDPSSVNLCDRSDGSCFAFDFLCNAQSTTIAKVTQVIPSAFVVQHVMISTDAVGADSLFVQLYSSADDNIATPLNTTGTPIITDGSAGNARCKAIGPNVQFWPMYWEKKAGQRIKITVYQLTLIGTKNITVSVSLLLLK